MRDSTGTRIRIGTFLLTALILSAATGLLTACGGGGGGGSSSSTPGSSPASSVSAGAIEEKGSIFVNGVEFETEGALLQFENQQPITLGANDDMLKVGMQVKVRGNVNDDGVTGQAESILVSDHVEGPIASVFIDSATLKTIVVMGQSILVEEGSTLFDNNDPALDSFADLDAGDAGMVVEVHGSMMADGSLLATFIEKKADDLTDFLAANPNNELEVKGEVSLLSGDTFRINDLIIDFSGVTVRNGALANGVFVEVKGSSFDSAANTLIASDVEVEDGLGEANVANAEIEGFVAGLTAGSFRVNGQRVAFSSATRFRGGLADDLADGVRVEVEGAIDADGIFQARQIKFEESVKLEDDLASISGNELTLTGLGLRVTVAGALTEFKEPGSLATLGFGDHLKIRARQSASGLVATRIEVLDPDTDIILQGAPSAISNATITILGVAVNTSTFDDLDASGDSDFEIEDNKVSRAEFFSAVSTESIVKAQGDLNSDGSISWKEVEIELED